MDDLKRYATVQRLGLIPSRKLPLIMYLGVASDHETAVFMVDSRLSQGGEGRCVPKDSLCTFLELKAEASQDEHHFRDADGNEYLLRLRGLTPLDRTRGQTSAAAASRSCAAAPRSSTARASRAVQTPHLQAVHVEVGSVAANADPSRLA